MDIGFHASHEQFPPSRLLTLARRAEAAGFDAVLSSDHLAPWSGRQAHSGFAWTWLGAAMATTSLPFGVVAAPGDRYHPVVLAQAIATLAEMFPGRFTPALGSGQALNEHVTGRPWPRKPVRNARLRECAEIMRRLFAGETVEHDGLVTVRAARVYSRPAAPPPLMAAALTPSTAREVAAWADGLITVNAPKSKLRRVIEAFRDGGGTGPVHVQVHLSWAEEESEVRAQAVDQWCANALPPELNEELELPEQFDAATEHVPSSALESSVLMSSDLARHVELLASCAELGIDRVYLHQVGRNQEHFLDVFGERVLPVLRG
ncbi:TIGR03885 family FMN-dependent LLM class oxidoreductase [Allokutzneria albata]|uniref:Probable non-F420 flavinoid oxidoreductase n=1 Tax=Allokutzneria albata TaxID=211114 RepID=A0A1G9URH8_ALLAB|nr:TIGR03885 family FMN-dependent LLM class oxidoreductase [Allokutzneria albata]SDM62155.1 probable non-F420 flavinoid oxidoreductase [Allokutzneria albata]